MGQDAKLFSMLSRPAGRIAGQIRDLSGKEIMALKVKITIRYKKERIVGQFPGFIQTFFSGLLHIVLLPRYLPCLVTGN